MDWWIANLLRDDPALLIAQIVWVIGSIVLHELAHGWAAIALGDNTPRETGHMTWNPLVHMGGMSLLMFALVGIAWGAMPVNRARLRGQHADVLVSLAGPAMNLLLAAVAVILGSLWSAYGQGFADPLWRSVMIFFIAGAFLNVSLAIFNLLPVPPLDGSRILAGVFEPYRRLISHPHASVAMLILLVLLMGRGGSMIFNAGSVVADRAFAVATSLLPGAPPYQRATRSHPAP